MRLGERLPTLADRLLDGDCLVELVLDELRTRWHFCVTPQNQEMDIGHASHGACQALGLDDGTPRRQTVLRESGAEGARL
jgi:hypothetical protein